MPSNTGGRELEQRHGLAGDELRAVDEDLHRRGRHPHRHPAAVALVDQLDASLLGEVGVGDDDLVDACSSSTAGRSSSAPSDRSPFSGRGVSET